LEILRSTEVLLSLEADDTVALQADGGVARSALRLLPNEASTTVDRTGKGVSPASGSLETRSVDRKIDHTKAGIPLLQSNLSLIVDQWLDAGQLQLLLGHQLLDDLGLDDLLEKFFSQELPDEGRLKGAVATHAVVSAVPVLAVDTARHPTVGAGHLLIFSSPDQRDRLATDIAVEGFRHYIFTTERNSWAANAPNW
jgi:hypothetical protein